MKDTGVLLLNTDGGSRKMHYSIVDGKIVTCTHPTSKKVEQIKANSEVTINLNDKIYNAILHEGSETAVELKEKYRNQMKSFTKIMNKWMGKEHSTVIVLEEK